MSFNDAHDQRLRALSQETGVPVDLLRTLAGISSPESEQMFEAEAAERAWMEARDDVSDEALVTRMNAAPDMGGALLVELGGLVPQRGVEVTALEPTQPRTRAQTQACIDAGRFAELTPRQAGEGQA